MGPYIRRWSFLRPIQPVGRDIGFLPGSMEDKMMPWLLPIQDNLQYLMGNDKLNLGKLHERWYNRDGSNNLH